MNDKQVSAVGDYIRWASKRKDGINTSLDSRIKSTMIPKYGPGPFTVIELAGVNSSNAQLIKIDIAANIGSLNTFDHGYFRLIRREKDTKPCGTLWCDLGE